MNIKFGPDFYQIFDDFPVDSFNQQKRKVMILEDERLLCWTLAETLVDMACSIVCVENGEEALRFIEKIKFHLMILDYGLPGMTGLDLLSILRKRGIPLPVIMMTASNDPGIEERAAKLDALRFLRKPFGPHILKKTVQAYFATHRRNRSTGDAGRNGMFV